MTIHLKFSFSPGLFKYAENSSLQQVKNKHLSESLSDTTWDDNDSSIEKVKLECQ